MEAKGTWRLGDLEVEASGSWWKPGGLEAWKWKLMGLGEIQGYMEAGRLGGFEEQASGSWWKTRMHGSHCM